MFVHLHSGSWLVLALALLLSAGCKEKRPTIPPTYPVTGKVTDKKGKPLGKIMVDFKPASGEDLRLITNATTADDGSFTPTTRHVDDPKHEKKDGLPEGEYRVTLTPSLAGERTKGLPTAVTLTKTVKVQQQGNNFTFVFDSPTAPAP